MKQSTDVYELAEEAATLVEQLGDLMLREWTAAEWINAKPMKKILDLDKGNRLKLLGDTALKCAAWAEHHQPAEDRRTFVKRFNGFLGLVNELLRDAKSIRYLSLAQLPGDNPMVILDDNSLLLARLAATHLPQTLRAWAREMRQRVAAQSVQAPPSESETVAPAQKSKRSTEKGEGRIKLIAALTKHHEYADGSCLNPDHIGNNELARLADVSGDTAHRFFKWAFGSHVEYKRICSAEAIAFQLKRLRDELSPAKEHQLYEEAMNIAVSRAKTDATE